MKILLIHSFFHYRGGDATYALELAEGLRERGHEVVPFAMRHPENDPSPWEIEFASLAAHYTATGTVSRVHAGLQAIWSRGAARRVRRLIRRIQPDVAHVQHVHRHLTPSVLRPLRRAGVPIVWTVHDYELICPSGHLFTQGAPCVRCKGHRYIEAWRHRCKHGDPQLSAAVAVEKYVHRALGVTDWVDRFLCPSAFLAQKLVEFGIPQDRVRHLPNFLRSERYGAAGELGQYWLYAGRLTAEKGVDTLIEAARLLPTRTLQIAGDGPLRVRLEQRAGPLGNVHFLGHLPRAELAVHVEKAGAIAVPSIWYENFPYAVTEAQAAGRPVVASRIGGIVEQITDGEDGRLVPPGDAAALAGAVDELLADPVSARLMGQAARRRVEAALDPDRHFERVEAAYEEVVAGGVGG